MAKKLTKLKAREILHDKEVHGHPLTDKQRKFFGAIAGGAKPYKAESGGWLDKYADGGEDPKPKPGWKGPKGVLTGKPEPKHWLSATSPEELKTSLQYQQQQKRIADEDINARLAKIIPRPTGDMPSYYPKPNMVGSQYVYSTQPEPSYIGPAESISVEERIRRNKQGIANKPWQYVDEAGNIKIKPEYEGEVDFSGNPIQPGKYTPEWYRGKKWDQFKENIATSAALTGLVYGAGYLAPYVGPALATEMFGIPGFTLGNALTSAGAASAITNLPTTAKSVQQAYETRNLSDIGEAATNLGFTALDLAPVSGPALRAAGRTTSVLGQGLREFGRDFGEHVGRRFRGDLRPNKFSNIIEYVDPETGISRMIKPGADINDLRRAYHNSERYLNIDEIRRLNTEGFGDAADYSTSGWRNRPASSISRTEADNITNISNENHRLAMRNRYVIPEEEVQQINSIDDVNDAFNRWLSQNQFRIPESESASIANRLQRSVGDKYGVDINTVFEAYDPDTYINNVIPTVEGRQNYYRDMIRSLTGDISSADATMFREHYNQIRTPLPVQRGDRNISGLRREDAIQRVSQKNKEKVANMTDSEFSQTVVKPDGEVIPYENATTQDVRNKYLSGEESVVPIGQDEYINQFNSKIDVLNDIIEKRNKTGVKYRAKGLSDAGKLTFETLDNNGIPIGESQWTVNINPGEWRGTVKDVPNTNYYREIPGLEMRNTGQSVFHDRVPRKGSGAYESINEYLKRFDLGRVKPGFNSQTQHSRSAWESFIKSNRAHGFYGDASTVYGAMKKNGGWLDKYEQGGLVLKQKTHDNYDLKPNANNSQVSFPPGFVGMGNNLKGRNYSPAWGGQFQDGGIKKALSSIPTSAIKVKRSLYKPDYTLTYSGDKNRVYPVQSSDIQQIINTAIGMHYDPRKALAIALQETGAGNSDPNYFHVLRGLNKQGKSILPEGYDELPDDVLGIQMLKDKEKIAHNLGYHTPEMELQTYNGLGKIFPDTERNYHGYRMKKIYGVPIPEEGLDMRKNPLYGKRVLDIKQNVVDKDKYVDQLVDHYTNFYNNPESIYYTRGTYLEPVVAPNKKKMQDGGNLIPPMAGADTSIPMYQMGGGIPGATGMMYARTINPAPANGPYAKKTKASAQDGKKLSYSQWKKQHNLKETPDYNLKRAWELGYTPDKTGHLPTVDNQTGQFLKAKGHPTLQLELDWYNSPEAADFRSKNAIDSSGKFFRYVPKGQNGQEMKYYQQGLDFTPKTISQNGSKIEEQRLAESGQGAPLSSIKKTHPKFYKWMTKEGKKPTGVYGMLSVKDNDPSTYTKASVAYEKSQNREPIYVSDPNDPRLRAYQDSLRLYNNSQKLYNRIKKTWPYKIGERKPFPNESVSPKQSGLNPLLRPNFLKKIYPEKIELMSPAEYINGKLVNEEDVRFVVHGYRFKKPVQPYFLQEEPTFEKPITIPRDTRDLGYTLPTPGQPTAPELYKYSPDTPTKFSFTYPTGGYNQQKTMYFPTKSALKSFVEGVRGATYQEGKDYASATGNLQDGGDIPVDPMGYWNPENVGGPVIIPSNQITMEGVDQPLIGISDTGDVQYMEPGEDYEFNGESVTEYPVAKKGVSIKQANLNPIKKLDQTLNFTNYNKPTKGGWLDKYN